MTHKRFEQRGISLIEALVALAVMAFGLLGVVGMQATLRSSADLSRQNSEAVRLAQEEVERWRNYAVLDAADATGDQLAFASIASAPASDVTTENSNASYTLETVVADVDPADPRVRHLSVTVRWTDRLGQDRNVVLNTLIAGTPPELGALPALRTDRGPLQQPAGRHSAIPRGAITSEDGATSSFTPPGAADGVRWIFNNTTGFITSICSSADPDSCTTTTRFLLSGTVAFATGGEPTSAEAENPTDAAVTLGMRVVTTVPGATENCFIDTSVANRRAYFCAVPVAITLRWSGRVEFTGLPLAADLAASSATTYKVCRYTPDLVNNTAANPPAGVPDVVYNARHPFRYIRVTQPLSSKNFLVISSGDGAAQAYTCPVDDPDTNVRSDTFAHQPAS